MSLLSDLNDKIKALSTRVAQQFKSQQTAIDSKVSTVNGVAPDENGNVAVTASGDFVRRTGDTMSGDLVVYKALRPRIRMYDPAVTKGVLPSADVYNEVIFSDSTEWERNPQYDDNGSGEAGDTAIPRDSSPNAGITGVNIKTTGVVQTYLRAYKWEANSTGSHTIGVEYDTANNMGYAYTTANRFRFGNGAQIWVA